MKKVLLALICSISIVSVQAEENGSGSVCQDTITLSSGYFEGQYSNDQLAGFGLELLRGGSRLEKFLISKVAPDNAIFAKIGSWAFGLLVHRAFIVAFHETGHGLRAKSVAGAEYSLETKHDDEDHSEFKKNENFFKFFGKKLFNTSRASCRISIHEENLPRDEYAVAEKNIIYTAGGMNNEMYFAERSADELYRKGNMSGIESFALLFDRLMPAMYAHSKKCSGDMDHDLDSGDDPVAIHATWKTMGISASKNNIESAGLISFFLSGSTWSVFRGMYRSFSTGNDYSAEPMTLCGFRIPDTFSYITSRGVSYKFVSGYDVKHQNLRVIFGLERIFHGKSAQEYSLGLEKTFASMNNTSARVVTTFGRGCNVEASCSVPVTKWLSINFGGSTYSSKSLLGERHARNMKKDNKRSSSIFVSASYKY